MPFQATYILFKNISDVGVYYPKTNGKKERESTVCIGYYSFCFRYMSLGYAEGIDPYIEIILNFCIDQLHSYFMLHIQSTTILQAPQSPVSLSSKCKPHPIADDLDFERSPNLQTASKKHALYQRSIPSFWGLLRA